MQKDKMQPHTYGLYIVHSDSCYFMRALSAASRCILISVLNVKPAKTRS
jgi:hypothetical protein